ncbi:polysaccharide deacetylase [Ectobacillus polymachus]|uniref:polysaccharide deacetylase n=1 Tax=Ectobacillus polymachus TaxID=1508806 RepID=UPI003A859C7C
MGDIAVMYHYVRNRRGWNGIQPLVPDTFEVQLDILSKHYEIVGPNDLNKISSKPKCVLTFDDATKDQYTIAYEILKRKGLPAYFTVLSGPIVNGVIPIFHLVQVVLSEYSDKEIWNDLNKEFNIKEIDKISTIYSYEQDKLRRYNKYILNFLLDEETSRKFLEKRVISKIRSVQNFIDEFYITKQEFLVMKQAGMTIGVHGVNHRPYCGNPLNFYKSEIEPCGDFIKKELGIEPKWYTSAFGGGERYKEMISDLEPVLKENGYLGGFITIEGLNNGLLNFWLKRFDCNKLPPLRNIDLKLL